jgi:hypothetical protein
VRGCPFFSPFAAFSREIRESAMARNNNPKRRKRRTLQEEIEDTQSRDQHEAVSVSISVTRGLYLHGLCAMRDGDYSSFSAYVSDLMRRDKRSKNTKPASLEPGYNANEKQVT